MKTTKMSIDCKAGDGKHPDRARYRSVKDLLLGCVEPKSNWSKSDWNDKHKEHTAGAIDYHNPHRSEHLIVAKEAHISR